MRLALIGAAGAAGALCRLGVANLLGVRPLPVATLVVNVVGSFVLGVVLVWAGAKLAPASAGHVGVSALTVGFLGAFTTFSTFAAETVALQESGRGMAAAGYVVASVVLGVGAAVAGLALGRWLVLASG